MFLPVVRAKAKQFVDVLAAEKTLFGNVEGKSERYFILDGSSS